MALAQAHETQRLLAQAFDIDQNCFEVVVISTAGDRILDRPLKEVGGKGLFTKEIEEKLLSGEIDIAVHSTKDMPTYQPDGLVLDCFLPREDCRDAFISNKYASIEKLPKGAVVGSSSLRRRAQLQHKRPDLQVVEFRGNVQTRLQKLADGVADATFLAAAGLNRLGKSEIITQYLEPEVMLPAVAQGAIGIERREEDDRAHSMLSRIHDSPTDHMLKAERAFLAALDGSCETPIAGLAMISGDRIRLRGEVLRPDGSQSMSRDETAPLDQAAALGTRMGEELLSEAGPDFFDWR